LKKRKGKKRVCQEKDRKKSTNQNTGTISGNNVTPEDGRETG